MDCFLQFVVDFDEWNKNEYADIIENGFQVFLITEGLIDTIVDLAETWLELVRRFFTYLLIYL